MNFLTGITNTGVQNVHAPLPLMAHILFCLIATALYIVQFKRKGLNYYIYLTIAVDLTLATQFYTQDYVILALAVAEIILLVMAFVSQHKNKKKIKAENEKAKQQEIMKQGENDSVAMKADVKKISQDEDKQ